jgi:hypothetical protein
MNNNFDWQTEDEAAWDELLPATPKSALSKHARPWRGWWLLLLGLLLIGGWLAWQQVAVRIAEAEAEATADLLASHDLLLQAAANQDEDVALALLSGRDVAWVAAQVDLVTTGLWLERPLLGLTYQEASSEAVTVTLSADLFTAEMVYDVRYQTETAAPVTLQHTAVYRRGADRWLYAPSETETWGEWQEQEYPRLTLRYRQHDADLAPRLGRDLSQAVTDLCLRVAGMTCPADFRVRVQLDPEPDSLLLLATAVLPHNQLAYHYRLPTPALVGRPLDEAGYQALSQGYAAWLLGGIVADQVGYVCCEQATIFRVLLDYQLSQIGLKEWPVDAAFYEQVIAERQLLDSFVSHWSGHQAAALSSEAGWQTYLLVDYLLNGPQTINQAAAALQQTLLESDHVYAWLEKYSSFERGVGQSALRSFERQLWFYAYVQTLSQAADPSPPLPTQDLLFACHLVAGLGTMRLLGGTTRLLRYDLAANRWQWQESFQGFPLMAAAPAADGVLLNRMAASADGQQVIWWRAGQTAPLTTAEDNVLTLGQLSPNGRFLVTYRPGGSVVTRLLLDLEHCTAAGCLLHEVPGDIIWSPDGQRSLILTHPDQAIPFMAGLHIARPGSLLLGDEAGRPLPGETLVTVRHPFWVDNDTFGYIINDEIEYQIVLLVEKGETRPLVMLRALAEQLPSPLPLLYLSIAYVLPSPYEAGHYFLLVYDYLDDNLHLLHYDAGRQAATHLTVFQTYGRQHGALPNVIWDTRYLILYDNTWAVGSLGTTRLFVYDLLEQTSQLYNTRPFPGWPSGRHTWTSDETWLAVLLGEGHLLLAIPHLDYTQVVTHEALAGCHAVVWVNR